MRRFGVGIFFALLFMTAGAPARAADDWRACNNISYRPIEITVPACTRLIEQGDLDTAELRLALRRRADAFYFGSSFKSVQAERTALLARALADIDGAIALDPAEAPPGDPPIWLGSLGLARADVLLELGRSKQAAEAYTEAMEKVPGAAAYARFGRALAFANLGRFDAALADMTALVESEPEETKWIFLRAEINEKAGRREAAIADYEATLRLNPDYVSAGQALERLRATGSDDD